MKIRKLIPVFLIIFQMFLQTSTALEPEVFSEYKIILDFERTDRVTVIHEFELENKLGVSIIPGIGTLDLVFDKNGEFMLGDLKAYDSDGIPIKAEFIGESVQYEIWTPLSPRGKYKMTIEYSISGPVSSGILFKEVRYPVLETSLPIQKGEIIVNAPKGYTITFADEATEYEKNTAKWGFTKTPVTADFEFSPLPLPRTSIRMVYIFWGIILTALIIINVLISTKNKKHTQKKKK